MQLLTEENINFVSGGTPQGGQATAGGAVAGAIAGANIGAEFGLAGGIFGVIGGAIIGGAIGFGAYELGDYFS